LCTNTLDSAAHPETDKMNAQQTIEIAKALPPRLIRFFQRYPPPQLFPKITTSIATPPPSEAASTTTPTSDPVAPVAEVSSTDATSAAAADPANLPFPNPFLPTKNFATGRWHGPVYGLRKQADLVKLAQQHGVVDLLPWTIKKPGEKEARRIERGLQVKGTGEGQKVKGKLWERTMKGRLEMRRQAMLNMPALIQEWKQVSCDGGEETVGDILANNFAEGTRSRVEEVAEWQGEEIERARYLGRKLAVGFIRFWGSCAMYIYVYVGSASCHGVQAAQSPALYKNRQKDCMSWTCSTNRTDQFGSHCDLYRSGDVLAMGYSTIPNIPYN
jgi:large subunit ribosomal protein L25